MTSEVRNEVNDVAGTIQNDAKEAADNLNQGTKSTQDTTDTSGTQNTQATINYGNDVVSDGNYRGYTD